MAKPLRYGKPLTFPSTDDRVIRFEILVLGSKKQYSLRLDDWTIVYEFPPGRNRKAEERNKTIDYFRRVVYFHKKCKFIPTNNKCHVNLPIAWSQRYLIVLNEPAAKWWRRWPSSKSNEGKNALYYRYSYVWLVDVMPEEQFMVAPQTNYIDLPSWSIINLRCKIIPRHYSPPEALHPLISNEVKIRISIDLSRRV